MHRFKLLLKKNFLENKIKFNKKILKIYLRNISLVTIIIYLISPIYLSYLNIDLKIDIIFILLSMYIFLYAWLHT